MTIEEGKKVISQLKAEGYDEEVILGSFYKLFQDDKLTLDELEGMVNLLGYSLTPEFKAMSPEEQKTEGIQDEEPEASKEEIEDAKEVDEDEDKPEDKPEGKSDEDEDEEAKAMKLLKADK